MSHLSHLSGDAVSGAPVSALLSVRGVGKRFGNHRVLRDVCFDVRAGEVHVLAGENGAGKSTLIRILGGVYGEYEGEIRVNGEKVRFGSTLEAARAGISVIHQELSLIDGLSVAENIFLGREKTRALSGSQWLDRPTQLRQAREICRELGLEIDVRKLVGEFPLSVKNSIEIAKALAWSASSSRRSGEPRGARILILDEPTSALNAQEAEKLFALMRKLKDQGYGLIYISHKMDEIYRLADRITVLRDGRCVATSTATALPREALVQRMVGRELSSQFPMRKHEIAPRAPGIPVRFSVRGLHAGLVQDVSLEVRAGEVLGIGGLQGSGATELLHAIFGAQGTLERGMIAIDGEPVRLRSPREAIRHGVALLTNDRKATGLVLSLSIRENIALAAQSSAPRHGLARLGWVARAREKSRAQAQSERLHIRARSLEQEVGTLSGGNQQKVALAKWLETEPKLLLLDEPTRGVDIGAKQEIYGLIRELTARGIAVIVLSTEMPELLALSDRIVVMHRGRLHAELSRAEATQESVLEAALGLERAVARPATSASPPNFANSEEEVILA